jgi:hypothetical protein
MEMTPNFKATRFSQLKAGELFLFPDDSGFGVALAAADPVEEDMVMIPLGPAPEKAGRLTRGPQENVLSFGNDYQLRLPCHPAGWAVDAPPADRLCFVLSSHGPEPSGQTLYLRATFGPTQPGLRFCYVDVKTGRILAFTNRWPPQYVPLGGICGYAVQWSLLTNETKPRVILSYPAPHGAGSVTGPEGQCREGE